MVKSGYTVEGCWLVEKWWRHLGVFDWMTWDLATDDLRCFVQLASP